MTSRAKALLLTARPKTLAAAVVPVMVATALARAEGFEVAWWISICALLSAVMIQVGTNFVNDALDFVKGADTETRLGEARAAQSGWFSHRFVLAGGFACFAVALVLGIPLAWVGGWPIVGIGLVSLALGYAYTGGPYPLAYVGLGDLFVILFFGVVAVGGVFYLQTHTLPTPALVAGLQVGLLATVLIAINNLRDLEQDRLVHKRTLAVRLGARFAKFEIPVLLAVAFALNAYWFNAGHPHAAIYSSCAIIPAVPVVAAVMTRPAGRAFNGLLARAAGVHVLFGVALSYGLLQR